LHLDVFVIKKLNSRGLRKMLMGWCMLGTLTFIESIVWLHIISFACNFHLDHHPHINKFLVLFSDEIGVIATHNISTIEWNGMICCFWKWKPHFNLVEQLGAKLSLLHAIKVWQFLDISYQFYNIANFTREIKDISELQAFDLDIK